MTYEVLEGRRFVMDGLTFINEPSTDTVTYSWTVQIDGGTGLTTANLAGANGLTVSFTAPLVDADTGVVLRLRFDDGVNAGDMANVTVRILDTPGVIPPTPNVPPVINLVATATATEGVLSTVRARVTDADTVLAGLTYRWTATPAAMVTVLPVAAVGETFTFTATLPDDVMEGTLTVRLTVAGGGNPVAPLVTITVRKGIDPKNHEAILPDTTRAIAGNLAGNIAARLGAVRGVGGFSLAGGQTAAAFLRDNWRARDVDAFGGTTFSMPYKFGGVGGGEVSDIAVWGGVDISNVGGNAATAAEFDGSLTGLNIGVGGKIGDKIGGVALSKISGSFDVTGETDDYEVDATIISPYVTWRDGELSYWATAGIGSGDTSQGGISEDLSMWSVGGGVDGVQSFGLALRGDVSHSDATGGDTGVSATRIRATADLADGVSGTVTHNGHAALRGDFGSGDIGWGLELGGHVSRVVDRLSLTARAKLLLFHTGDASEWGICGDVRYRTAADGQGASFHLTPTMGDDAAKLNTTLNFGVGTAWGMVTPFTVITIGNDTVHRLGINWKTRHGLLFGLTADGNETLLKFGL